MAGFFAAAFATTALTAFDTSTVPALCALEMLTLMLSVPLYRLILSFGDVAIDTVATSERRITCPLFVISGTFCKSISVSGFEEAEVLMSCLPCSTVPTGIVKSVVEIYVAIFDMVMPYCCSFSLCSVMLIYCDSPPETETSAMSAIRSSSGSISSSTKASTSTSAVEVTESVITGIAFMFISTITGS